MLKMALPDMSIADQQKGVSEHFNTLQNGQVNAEMQPGQLGGRSTTSLQMNAPEGLQTMRGPSFTRRSYQGDVSIVIHFTLLR